MERPCEMAQWLSLGKRNSDPARFLMYLIAAIQTTDADIGQLASEALQSGQHPSVEAMLTSLLNEITMLGFLLNHVPVSRLRVRDKLTELQVTDLRFTLDEAAEFLN